MSRTQVSFRKLSKLNFNGIVEKDKDLSKLTTFKCGGRVKYFVVINTIENFLHVMIYLKECRAKYYILGNGSNVLVSNNGFDGVVIKLLGDFARIERVSEIELEIGAGVVLSEAYVMTRNLGLGGFECSAGIPATIGGATCMNASAYDFQMSKIIDYVIAYIDGKISFIKNENCGFGYRHSVFQENGAIILRVGFKLEKKDPKEMQIIYRDTLERRKQSQPIEFPSAGCVFRNIEGIVVGKLLDDCGMKGLTIGGASVSKKHANFIINMGNAKAQDIYSLIEIIKRSIKDKTGHDLKTEIRFLGEFNETIR